MDRLSMPCQEAEPLPYHKYEETPWHKDKIPDTEVLTRASLSSIHTILMQTQLRWAGHVVCIPDHQLPKKLLLSE